MNSIIIPKWHSGETRFYKLFLSGSYYAFINPDEWKIEERLSNKDGNQSKYHFSTPHPPWRAPSPQGEGFPSLIEIVDSATPGKPCVQNDMRVRWEIGTKNQFIKVCFYKRHKMNCLCSLSKTWINQKPIYTASIHNQCTQHQSITNEQGINP